jgi:hypothetical protein
MIRIMTADEPEAITITVDGKLSDQSIDPVEGCCMQALSQGKPVRVFLRDVSSIDERGRTMLQRLVAAGIHLSANGIYSAYIVQEIQSAGLKKRHCSR